MKQHGITLYEALAMLALIMLLVSLGQPMLANLIKNQHSMTLKTNLKHALRLSKQYAMTTQQTLVFCVGHDAECFKQPITEALLYADIFHDGKLHIASQLRKSFSLPNIKGSLLLRTYPHYRKALLFTMHDRLASDNGTFWFCTEKNSHPAWAFSINRHAMIHDIKATATGEIIDPKGNRLVC